MRSKDRVAYSCLFEHLPRSKPCVRRASFRKGRAIFSTGRRLFWEATHSLMTPARCAARWRRSRTEYCGNRLAASCRRACCCRAGWCSRPVVEHGPASVQDWRNGGRARSAGIIPTRIAKRRSSRRRRTLGSMQRPVPVDVRQPASSPGRARRRRAIPRPARPAASNAKVPGSGVAVGPSTTRSR